MTSREILRYMLAVCTLWVLTYWKQILFTIGIIVIVLLLASCTVGTLPTATPVITPIPSATVWPTNTPSPTITLTRSLTPSPTTNQETTPTAELTLPAQTVECMPLELKAVVRETTLYADPGLTTPRLYHIYADGRVQFVEAVLHEGKQVMVLWERSVVSCHVLLVDGTDLMGWLDCDDLPVECR